MKTLTFINCFYNPFRNNVSKSLDVLSSKYDYTIILCDFNAE